MLVTSREHQRMQCSLMVQQALGRLDQPRHSSSSSSSAAPPTPDSQLDSELVAGTVQKAFNRYVEILGAVLYKSQRQQKQPHRPLFSPNNTK